MFDNNVGVKCAFPSQGLLEEADEEKKRLQGENEMLKALMKKEVDRLDSELAAKANVVDEYKRVVKQLSQKVDAAERRARHAEGGEILSLQHGLSLLDFGSRCRSCDGTGGGEVQVYRLKEGTRRWSLDYPVCTPPHHDITFVIPPLQGKRRHRKRTGAARHRRVPRPSRTRRRAPCPAWGWPTPGYGSWNWSWPRRSWPSWRRSARIKTSPTRFAFVYRAEKKVLLLGCENVAGKLRQKW